MRNASGHNYWNSSFIIDVAMGQIPRSTERISSLKYVEKSANLQAKHTATTATRNRRRPEIGTLDDVIELSPWLLLMKLMSISRYRF